MVVSLIFPSRDDAELAHQKAIDRMCSANLQSLEISYTSLSIFAPTLAIWLADIPKIMLEIFNQGEVVNECNPDYNTIHDEIFVRIRGNSGDKIKMPHQIKYINESCLLV
jgi:DNA replication licensing factor MCM2